jgi:hypothetical protein
MATLEPPRPVDTGPLFAPLHDELLSLLRGLPRNWTRPTAAGAWLVRDVVAHLLDVILRRLSYHRDGHRARARPNGARGVTFLNGLNREWVRAAAPQPPV